jgi:hypothetical protein
MVPLEQVGCSQPAGQAHVKPPSVLVQVPPFLQGVVVHSFTSMAQVGPVHAGGHAQEKAFTRSVQVPPFKQGRIRHSSMLTEQFSPSQPGWQVHVMPPVTSLQVPFTHGFGSQSTGSSSHVGPEYPVVHSQLNASTPSVHVPPFRHGFGSQSSMFV